MKEKPRPSHHSADGRFQNPWPDSAHSGTPLALLKWQWQRLRNGRPPAPDRAKFSISVPQIARPHAAPDECRVTWLGQSGFLLQAAGKNILLDPLLSSRASPFGWLGPARLVDAQLAIEDLPSIDALVLSHDHYDHLDVRTMRAVLRRFPNVRVFAPLGYRGWFAGVGAAGVTELDWWESAALPDSSIELVCLPAQHWTRRGLDTSKRLWSSWLVRTPHQTIYFCGDSGYCPAFREIRERVTAPDIALMPIGAYEPRWFMKAAHMNPEESVQAFMDLGARDFVAMHWGTFRLTDEPMLEPPERLRKAWQAHGLPSAHVHIPNHGQTIVWRGKELV